MDIPDIKTEDLNVEYAFLVVKHKDGGRISVGTFDELKADRQPTPDDMFAALKLLEKDLVTTQQANAVVEILRGGVPDQVVQPGSIEPKSKFTKITRDIKK